jgi:DNA polymerase III epsilon subunit-like protein
MSWWDRWRRPEPTTPDASLPERWVVVDVETTGLDLRHDHLLAIAAIGLQVQQQAAPRILATDTFEAVLQRPDALADKANILIHGIGVQAQRQGQPAAQALTEFEQWLGDAPLLGFHTLFDVTMLSRAFNDHQGRWLRYRVHPAPPRQCRRLGHRRAAASAVAQTQATALHELAVHAETDHSAALVGQLTAAQPRHITKLVCLTAP